MVLWCEITCLGCGEINWVFLGDSEEFKDGNSAEGFECFNCCQRFWLDEDDSKEDIDSVFIEEGKSNPTI